MSFALGTIGRGLLTGCASAEAAKSSAWKTGDGAGDARMTQVNRRGVCQRNML